jgi:predicted metal-dependent enzyme (double-stranded beta helix superfamily)
MAVELSRRAFIHSAIATVSVASVAASQAGEPDSPSAKSVVTDEQRRFVEELRAVGARAANPADSQAAVAEFLRSAVHDASGRLNFLRLPTSAGIHALHSSPELTILNVVWSPRMVLFPHNHNMWATIAVYGGREDNILWKRQGETIAAERASSLSERDVLTLPVDVIHSVVNPIAQLTGAIHVYGGDFFATRRSEWDAQTLRERPWSLEAAVRAFKEANACFEASRA